MKNTPKLKERPTLTSSKLFVSNKLEDKHESKIRSRRAAFLSIIPGLGQIYNRQYGKGALFLVTFLVNLVTFVALLYSKQTLALLSSIASKQNYQLNAEALKWLQSAAIDSPFIFICFALLVSFVVYAVKDASIQAKYKRNQQPFQLSLAETASGTYLLHFAILIFMLFASLFMVVPEKPTEQITEIELVVPKAEVPKPKSEPKKQAPKQIAKEITPVPVKPEPPKQQLTPSPIVTTAPIDTTATSPVATNSPPPSSTSSGDAQAGAGAGSGQEVDFGPYLAEMQKRIKKAWFPPKGNESKRITVKFKIHKDGEVTSVKLEKSSGFALADDAALEAIDKASPFPPLPSGADSVVVIKFTFDYTIFGSNNQNISKLDSQGTSSQ